MCGGIRGEEKEKFATILSLINVWCFLWQVFYFLVMINFLLKKLCVLFGPIWLERNARHIPNTNWCFHGRSNPAFLLHAWKIDILFIEEIQLIFFLFTRKIWHQTIEQCNTWKIKTIFLCITEFSCHISTPFIYSYFNRGPLTPLRVAYSTIST